MLIVLSVNQRILIVKKHCALQHASILRSFANHRDFPARETTTNIIITPPSSSSSFWPAFVLLKLCYFYVNIKLKYVLLFPLQTGYRNYLAEGIVIAVVRIGVSMAPELGHASGLSDVMATGKTAEIQELWPVVAEKKGKNERLQPVREPIYQ